MFPSRVSAAVEDPAANLCGVHGTGDVSARWEQWGSFGLEDEVLAEARTRAEESGAGPVEPGAGAGLRFLATALCARAVVEVGTGAGVSGLWLLRGMAEDGVLTSIDVEPEHQRLARAAFVEAGFTQSRFRLINGVASEVLPRLADNAYDLVFLDGVRAEYPRYLEEAVRLLRPGGVVALAVVPAVEADGGGPAASEAAQALREVSRLCREDDRLAPLLLPLGDGLLVAVGTGVGERPVSRR